MLEVQEVVTTDTVAIDGGPSSLKVTTLSVAPLLSEAISRIHHGESVSSLFSQPDWIADARLSR